MVMPQTAGIGPESEILIPGPAKFMIIIKAERVLLLKNFCIISFDI